MSNKIKHFCFFNNTDKFVVAVNGMHGLVSQAKAKEAQIILNDEDFFDNYVGCFEIVPPHKGAEDGEPITNTQAIDIMDYLFKLKSRKDKHFKQSMAQPTLYERLQGYKWSKLSHNEQCDYFANIDQNEPIPYLDDDE